MDLFLTHILLYGMLVQRLVCRPPGCHLRLEVGSSKGRCRRPTCLICAGYNRVHTATAGLPLCERAGCSVRTARFCVFCRRWERSTASLPSDHPRQPGTSIPHRRARRTAIRRNASETTLLRTPGPLGKTLYRSPASVLLPASVQHRRRDGRRW